MHQRIKYSQGFLEKANTLWYQFLALLIPSYFIIFEMILGGAFRRRILSSVEWSEVAYMKDQSHGHKHYLQSKYDF